MSLRSGNTSAIHADPDPQGSDGDIALKEGYVIKAAEGASKALVELLKSSLEKNIFGAVLVPVRINGGYNYVLTRSIDLLNKAEIMPPVMSVQGGKVLQALTRHGKSGKIAAVMRMCEIRAAVELSKLEQTDLENVFFISVDCNGVTPLSDYLEDPSNAGKKFRPLCEICTSFSVVGDEEVKAVDIHAATMGVDKGKVLLIPMSPDGKEMLEKLGIDEKQDTANWVKEIEKLRKQRIAAREKALAEIKETIKGLNGLAEVFSRCIECHNCRSVCPICYCRLCFSDKETFRETGGEYLDRAKVQGVMKCTDELLQFHLGRMSHMSLSCVSCGMCEDACPMDIPVGQIFSVVAEQTQAIFNYVPGKSPDEEQPLRTFGLDELTEVEDK
jgi:formate dehydrogenase subunit beta